MRRPCRTDAQPALHAVGYCRVSTAQQRDDGLSLDVQREKIEAWCRANGRNLIAVHVDAGISGKAMDNRPGLTAALDDACANGAVLVFYSMSRVARSTRDMLAISERLSAAGADMCSLSGERIDTTSAAGRMVFRMLAVIGEFERDLTTERTAAAMQYMRDRGEYTGGPVPYGWTLVGEELAPDRDGQRAIHLARQLHEAGYSLRRIGAQLTAAGLHPNTDCRWPVGRTLLRQGGTWAPQMVSNLIDARLAQEVASTQG